MEDPTLIRDTITTRYGSPPHLDSSYTDFNDLSMKDLYVSCDNNEDSHAVAHIIETRTSSTKIYHGVRIEMAQLLDIPSSSGKDYQGLMDALGFIVRDIKWLPELVRVAGASPTVFLLAQYDDQPDACLEHVVGALNKLGRHDVILRLRTAFPDVDVLACTRIYEHDKKIGRVHAKLSVPPHISQGARTHPAHSLCPSPSRASQEEFDSGCYSSLQSPEHPTIDGRSYLTQEIVNNNAPTPRPTPPLPPTVFAVNSHSDTLTTSKYASKRRRPRSNSGNASHKTVLAEPPAAYLTDVSPQVEDAPTPVSVCARVPGHPGIGIGSPESAAAWHRAARGTSPEAEWMASTSPAAIFPTLPPLPEMPVVKILLTYALANEQHLQQVLTEKKLLVSTRRFSVDVISGGVEERQLIERVRQAEFVVVFVSTCYAKLVQQSSAKRDRHAPVRAVAAELQRQQLADPARNKAFIPVLLPGVRPGMIPAWLAPRGGAVHYELPQQRRDLHFYLSRPEHVMKCLMTQLTLETCSRLGV